MRKDTGKKMSRNGEMISRSLVVPSPSLLTSRIVNGGRNRRRRRRRLQEMTHSMKGWYLQALKRTSVITDKHECMAAKRFLGKCRRLLQSMIMVRRRRMQQHMLNNDDKNQLRIGGSGNCNGCSDITMTADGVMMEKTTNHKLVLFYTGISYLTPSFPSIGVIAWILHHMTLSAVRSLRSGDSTRQIDPREDDTRTTIATAIERWSTINIAANKSGNCDRFMTNVRCDWIAHDWIHLFELNADFTESYAHLCILLQTLNYDDDDDDDDDEIVERRELRNRKGGEEDTENENDNKIYSSIVFDHLFIWNNMIPLLTAVDATRTITATTWFLPNLFIRKRQIEQETERQFERSRHTSAIVAEKIIQPYKYSCSWIPNE